MKKIDIKKYRVDPDFKIPKTENEKNSSKNSKSDLLSHSEVLKTKKDTTKKTQKTNFFPTISFGTFTKYQKLNDFHSPLNYNISGEHLNIKPIDTFTNSHQLDIDCQVCSTKIINRNFKYCPKRRSKIIPISDQKS